MKELSLLENCNANWDLVAMNKNDKTFCRTAPIGIFFLIPGKILEIDHFGAMMAQLGIYVMTVFAGLLIHSLITLPMLYFLCTRKSPFKLLSQIAPALITAFGTSSRCANIISIILKQICGRV